MAEYWIDLLDGSQQWTSADGWPEVEPVDGVLTHTDTGGGSSAGVNASDYGTNGHKILAVDVSVEMQFSSHLGQWQDPKLNVYSEQYTMAAEVGLEDQGSYLFRLDQEIPVESGELGDWRYISIRSGYPRSEAYPITTTVRRLRLLMSDGILPPADRDPINLLTDPGLWNGGEAWDGSAYTWELNGYHGGLELNGPIRDGDTLAGTVGGLGEDYYGNTLDCLFIEDGNVLERVEIPIGGEPVPFSFPVKYGSTYEIRAVVGDSWGPMEIYGGQLTIAPAEPEPDPEPEVRISYNCECEDPARPKATLAELRQKLFARLGFTDPQGDAPPRTLGDMVNELLVRLGRAGNAAKGALAPGVFDLMASFVRDAQESLWHEYELGQTGDDQVLKPLVDPEDTTTLDSWAVFNMALGLAKAHYGAKDAEVYLNRVNKYIADRMKRGPVGSTQLANSFLHSAQTFLFDKVASFRQSRYYRWPLQAGVRFYDFDGNDDECGKKMVPETVEWVGVSEGPEGDDRWRELWCGIETTLYTGGIRNSMPQRYEMRQCIEVWPAPDGREAYLRVKAKFGLSRFTEDDDETTIDPELVLLQALAMAKAHYNHPDASSYAGMVQSRIGDITAGSHHTRRYIPGHEVRHVPLPPRPRDGFIEN